MSATVNERITPAADDEKLHHRYIAKAAGSRRSKTNMVKGDLRMIQDIVNSSEFENSDIFKQQAKSPTNIPYFTHLVE